MGLKAVARRAPEIVNVSILTATQAVTQDVFVADRKYRVELVSETHGTAGNDAGAVTLDIVKCTGTTAAASGTTVLGSTFNMKSTANTPVTKSKRNGGVVSTAVGFLNAGDRLAVKITGTPTSYAGGNVQIVLNPVTGLEV